ncbi:MAG: SOS response-associated peptidase [Pseudomonadota bacterium]
MSAHLFVLTVMFMCGLYNLSHSSDEVAAYFDYGDTVEFPPRDYVAPGGPVAIVRHNENDRSGARRFALVRWGFVPSWAKEVKDGKPLINARAETVAEKPSFRNAYRRRRCLVPASGFYEWQGDVPGRKVPFYVPRADGKPLAFGGIWEHWMGPDGSELESVAILTTAANAQLAAIHHRMPVVIAQGDFARWLGNEDRPDDLLRPVPEGFFAPVTTEMKRKPVAPKPLEPKPQSDQLDLF